MANFNETCGNTSGKCFAEQGTVMSNCWKSFHTLWLHSASFAIKKAKHLRFQNFFPFRRHLHLRAPTSGKYVAEQGLVMSNWLKTFQRFWSHFSIFGLEKQPKNLKFQSSFYLKETLLRLRSMKRVHLLPGNM